MVRKPTFVHSSVEIHWEDIFYLITGTCNKSTFSMKQIPSTAKKKRQKNTRRKLLEFVHYIYIFNGICGNRDIDPNFHTVITLLKRSGGEPPLFFLRK